jgi:hypothetical protein
LMSSTSTISDSLSFGAIEASAVNKDPLRCDFPGMFVDESKADRPCTPCPVNFYCPYILVKDVILSTSSPVACPTELTTNIKGNTWVKGAPGGLEANGLWAFSITQCKCPITKLDDGTGQNKCVPIPQNPCEADYYRLASGECGKCPEGTKSQAGSTKLEQCIKIVVIIICVGNTFNTATGMTPCNDCPTGYTASADKKACLPPPCEGETVRNTVTQTCDCKVTGQLYNPATKTCSTPPSKVVCTIEGQLINSKDQCVCPTKQIEKKGKCVKRSKAPCTGNVLEIAACLCAAATVVGSIANKRLSICGFGGKKKPPVAPDSSCKAVWKKSQVPAFGKELEDYRAANKGKYPTYEGYQAIFAKYQSEILAAGKWETITTSYENGVCKYVTTNKTIPNTPVVPNDPTPPVSDVKYCKSVLIYVQGSKELYSPINQKVTEAQYLKTYKKGNRIDGQKNVPNSGKLITNLTNSVDGDGNCIPTKPDSSR